VARPAFELSLLFSFATRRTFLTLQLMHNGTYGIRFILPIAESLPTPLQDFFSMLPYEIFAEIAGSFGFLEVKRYVFAKISLRPQFLIFKFSRSFQTYRLQAVNKQWEAYLNPIAEDLFPNNTPYFVLTKRGIEKFTFRRSDQRQGKTLKLSRSPELVYRISYLSSSNKLIIFDSKWSNLLISSIDAGTGKVLWDHNIGDVSEAHITADKRFILAQSQISDGIKLNVYSVDTGDLIRTVDLARRAWAFFSSRLHPNFAVCYPPASDAMIYLQIFDLTLDGPLSSGVIVPINPYPPPSPLVQDPPQILFGYNSFIKAYPSTNEMVIASLPFNTASKKIPDNELNGTRPVPHPLPFLLRLTFYSYRASYIPNSRHFCHLQCYSSKIPAFLGLLQYCLRYTIAANENTSSHLSRATSHRSGPDCIK